jgi:hypothetical protein
MKVARLSALRTGRLYPHETFLVLILLEAESTPGPLCDRRDCQLKNPTPSGIEPATFRFVAQCLNQYATTRPLNNTNRKLITSRWYVTLNDHGSIGNDIASYVCIQRLLMTLAGQNMQLTVNSPLLYNKYI